MAVRVAGTATRDRAGGWVLALGLATVAASALWLVATGHPGIRYSADTAGTAPFWHRWVPVAVALVLVRLVPPGDPAPRTPGAGRRGARLEAVVLVAAAAALAVVLRLLTGGAGGEPVSSGLKLLLLLAVPLLLFRVRRRRGAQWALPPARPAPWRGLAPAVPVAAWLVLGYATPLALPRGDYGFDPLTWVVVVLVVFAANALLEEVFYRRWLQSRLEVLLGRWAAIVLASLLWAAWHTGIQGTGRLDVDVASVVVNQGVLGLFLGYLWSRYRRMWPLLVVHGVINVPW